MPSHSPKNEMDSLNSFFSIISGGVEKIYSKVSSMIFKPKASPPIPPQFQVFFALLFHIRSHLLLLLLFCFFFSFFLFLF